MCGINGFVSKNNLETTAINGIIEIMNNEIIHRGPDQDGFFIEKKQQFSIGMAIE